MGDSGSAIEIPLNSGHQRGGCNLSPLAETARGKSSGRTLGCLCSGPQSSGNLAEAAPASPRPAYSRTCAGPHDLSPRTSVFSGPLTESQHVGFRKGVLGNVLYGVCNFTIVGIFGSLGVSWCDTVPCVVPKPHELVRLGENSIELEIKPNSRPRYLYCTIVTLPSRRSIIDEHRGGHEIMPIGAEDLLKFCGMIRSRSWVCHLDRSDSHEIRGLPDAMFRCHGWRDGGPTLWRCDVVAYNLPSDSILHQTIMHLVAITTEGA